jgi:hypothetical protein
MVVVLTKTEWKALMKIMAKVEGATRRTQSGVDCAILVHPKAASAYKKRTSREITDFDSRIEHSFDASDFKFDLVGHDEVKFAKKGGAQTAPEGIARCLPALLKSIGRGPDGVTELPKCAETT